MRKVYLLLFLFYLNQTEAQQSSLPNPPWYQTTGIEFQAYPAGQIYGIRIEQTYKWFHNFNLRIGYNRAFRKNFSGLNDNEQGGGLGISPGYRYNFLKGSFWKLYAGVRCDLWWLNIHWKDKNHIPREGTSSITVLQPTAQIEYEVKSNSHWSITLSLAFGREINIITKGKPVGQGGISLAGISITRSIF